MIVKIRNSEDSWSYFECEIIHSRHSLLKNETLLLADSFVLLEEDWAVGNPKTSVLNVKILNLETKKIPLRTILTDKVCYVLNNEGKTIDKI